MTDEERYREIDLPFYQKEIAPMLPERVLDFHVHTWSAENWTCPPWDHAGGKYMVTTELYSPEQLLADGKACFPDRSYHAVCFGYPCPVADWAKDTAYIAAAAREHENLWPLVLGGKGLEKSRQQYSEVIARDGFCGFKVILNWQGNDYGDVRVQSGLRSCGVRRAARNVVVIS